MKECREYDKFLNKHDAVIRDIIAETGFGEVSTTIEQIRDGKVRIILRAGASYRYVIHLSELKDCETAA